MISVIYDEDKKSSKTKIVRFIKPQEYVPGYIVVYSCFIILFFNDPLSRALPALKYFDEIMTVLGVAVILFHLTHKRLQTPIININEFKSLSALIVTIYIGALSNVTYDLNRDWVSILTDLVAMIKFFVIYLSIKIVLNRMDKLKILKTICFFAKLFILISLFFYFFNQLNPIFETSYTRFGIESYCFIFNNPAIFGNLCVGVGYLLLMEGSKKVSFIWIVIISALMILTLRYKLFFSALTFIWINLLLSVNVRLRLIQYPIFIIAAIIISFSQIKYTFFSVSETPRSILLEYGIETAKRYFPVGSGFAAYGSAAAAKAYSPLYREYGFEKIYGLGQFDEVSYLQDNTWPMIFAQFGWVGAGMYFLSIYYLFKGIMQSGYDYLNRRYAALFLLICILASSLGGPIFSGPMGALYSFLLALSGPNIGRKYLRKKS